MATWDVEIAVVDLQSKQVNITATRTDVDDVRVYTLRRVNVDTHDRPLAEIRAEIGAKLWGMYQAELAADGQVATLLSGWEIALESDLNGMES
ncbi:MAG: hypothetical protein ACYTF6_13535 [Planctomycetota bacterium]|jgi:hypothetical protein